MDRAKIEENQDGTYKLTLPLGGGSASLNANDVIRFLKEEEQRFQKALDDLRAVREWFEHKIAKG